jgi:phage/plasmid-associated DNA primase
LGAEHIGIMREQLFTNRFELARFVGKKLIVHPDMPTEFLSTPKASILKQLVGGDMMWADLKRKQEPASLHGDMGVILCTNGKPRIPIDGDEDAWIRRLAMIEVKKPAGGKRIGKLSEILSNVEKSGLLNWMLEGRQRVIEQGYQLHLSELQEKRIMGLVRNSTSGTLFIEECLVPEDSGELAAEEVRRAYVSFCRQREIEQVRAEGFTKWMSGQLKVKWGIHERHDVRRQGKAKRGWCGLRLKAEWENETTSKSE